MYHKRNVLVTTLIFIFILPYSNESTFSLCQWDVLALFGIKCILEKRSWLTMYPSLLMCSSFKIGVKSRLSPMFVKLDKTQGSDDFHYCCLELHMWIRPHSLSNISCMLYILSCWQFKSYRGRWVYTSIYISYGLISKHTLFMQNCSKGDCSAKLQYRVWVWVWFIIIITCVHIYKYINNKSHKMHIIMHYNIIEKI